ncbi:FAD-dependent oxidoreductase [Aliiruegeria sabulilitoris]|uniref:FAD-dependent oxidoreductase n=1 Tax=Aliiruegeria sabulilitoris TaxID=1510458 RepID=UPI00082F47CD|nr:FAD-dependent oxidoreductase [Aliiruegeria sabulilitoris]NDR55059.1 N-acyl homoserine lactone synthase [Pseudoruegeria sp. M32A2M]
MNKKVVIVGGGYVGTELAQSLERYCDVTLVERKKFFCHAPAMIRSLVQPDLLEKALFPYDKLLQRGQVMQASVMAVSESGVTLENGKALAADAIVVATGSSHDTAFKAPGASVDDLRAANRALAQQIEGAASIAIIGGGALGVELAGEIKAVRPQKHVTLVSDSSLTDGYDPRLGQGLEAKLGLLGVEVITGQKAVDLPQTRGAFAGPVRLADGREIAAELVIPALGSTPNTALLDPLPGVEKTADGRVRNDRWMRPSELPNVFAAGDAADNGDQMTIVGASRQTPWLARNLRNFLAGKRMDLTPAYGPWRRPPLLVPLGEHVGQSILPVVGLVGSRTTRLVKGRDLFLPKYRKLFRTG